MGKNQKYRFGENVYVMGNVYEDGMGILSGIGRFSS